MLQLANNATITKHMLATWQLELSQTGAANDVDTYTCLQSAAFVTYLAFLDKWITLDDNTLL